MRCRRGCARGQIEVVAPPDETSAGTPMVVCCDCDEGHELYTRRMVAAEAQGSRGRPPASVRAYETGAWIIRPEPRDLVPLRVQRSWGRAGKPDVAALARDLAPVPDEAPPPPDERMGWRADGDEPADSW